MLNFIWLGLLLFGVLVAGITGQIAAINQGALNAAKSAIMDVALPLCGAMTLWLGMVGLIQHIARFIRPILVRLFSDVPPDHPAMGSIVMNMAANMLGVSNAATPLGLRAMSQLNELNTKQGVATNAMCTFLAINTSSIQLVPATAINILAINGSKNPTGIVAFNRDILRHLVRARYGQVPGTPWSVSLGKTDGPPGDPKRAAAA